MKVIDLFCGAGGLSEGFEDAGFKIVIGNDIDKNMIASFKINHPESKAICGDISKINVDDLLNEIKETKEEIDLVIGGPPCQGFSTVGNRGEDDQRNKLFYEFVRFVREVKPKMFVMENVTGILTMKKGEVKKIVKQEFENLGYKVKIQILRGEDFGVPQKRRRVFFVGHKFENDFEFPEPEFDGITMSYLGTGTGTDYLGAKFTPKTDLKIIGLMQGTDCTGNDADIYDASNNLVYSSSGVDGLNISFGAGYDLTSGVMYSVLVGGGGGSYNKCYGDGTLPIDDIRITWNYGTASAGFPNTSSGIYMAQALVFGLEAQPCTFNGTVKDGDGNAINGARIVIDYAGTDVSFGNTTSDANGLWNLNVTADGNFSVYAYQPGNITRPGDIKSYVECIRV